MKTFEGIDFPCVSFEHGFRHRKQELIREETLPTVERGFRFRDSDTANRGASGILVRVRTCGLPTP